MAEVFNTINGPNGEAVSANVEVRLIASSSNPDAGGFVPDEQKEILAKWSASTNASGYWSVDLTPNSNIDPNGTYYEVIERYQPGNRTNRMYFSVPDSASPSFWVVDLLIVNPSTVDSLVYASQITVVPSGALTSTDVQSALEELQSEISIGSGDLTYVHTQNSPSTTWNVAHNLGKLPSITIVDSGGTEVVGEVTHTDSDNAVLTFSAAFSGKAYVN